MTTDTEALVTRLREHEAALRGPDYLEAADLIERLTRERDEARARQQQLWDERRQILEDAGGEQFDLLKRAEAAEADLARLREAASRENDDICQTLGKALGYPWFKDDQKNFPGATEENGVCVGEHVAGSIAMEAARTLSALRERVARLEAALREAVGALRLAGVYLSTNYSPGLEQAALDRGTIDTAIARARAELGEG